MAVSTNADDLARELGIMQADMRRLNSLMSGGFGSGLTNPAVDFLQASEIKIAGVAIDFLSLASTNHQEIISGTTIAIEWNRTQRFSGGFSFSSEAGKSTDIGLPAAVNNTFLVGGNVLFSANSSGRRVINIAFYNNAGILQFGDTLISAPAVAAPDVTSYSFFASPGSANFDPSSVNKMRVEVSQNSGTTVTINRASFFITRLS